MNRRLLKITFKSSELVDIEQINEIYIEFIIIFKVGNKRNGKIL